MSFELSSGMDVLQNHKRAMGMFLLTSLIALVQSPAQVPISPTKRPITGGGSANVGVAPKAPEKPVVKTTTYLTLSEARQWTSIDGKPLLAKLIAFEDIVTENTNSAIEPVAIPTMMPTLIKDGKVRLLVNGKPFELALDRLSQPDRDLIEKIRSAIQKKSAPGK